MGNNQQVRELELGRVYRVTVSYGTGPKNKRRTLGRFIGRLIFSQNGLAEFQVNKRVRRTVDIKSIVELRYVEEG